MLSRSKAAKTVVSFLNSLQQFQHVYIPIERDARLAYQWAVHNFAQSRDLTFITKVVRHRDKGLCLFVFRHI